MFLNPTVLYLLLGILTASKDATPPTMPAQILFPTTRSVIVNIATISITGEYDTSTVGSVVFLKPFEASKDIPIGRDAQKLDFAKQLYGMIPGDFIFGGIEFSSNRDNLGYRYEAVNLVDIERFWESTDLKRIWKLVHDKKAQTSNVKVYGWTQSTFENTEEKRSAMKDIFALSIPLRPGMNAFRILYLDKSGKTLAEDSLGVFYTIPTLEDSPPDDYEAVEFHVSDAVVRCLSCHADDPEAEEPELDCATCHQNLTHLKSFHPAAEDCATCHDMSSEEEFRLIDGQSMNSEFCFMCHSDKQETVESAEVEHPVVFECATCHDQHSSMFDTLLRDKILNLCTSCHADQLKRAHPAPNHPYEAASENNRPGKELSCASCHNPHGSKLVKLIRFDKMPICGNCHGR